MLYGDWIGRWGRSFPEKEALVDVIENRRYTYGQLAEDVNRMANFLAPGIGNWSGDRVACLSFNRAEYIKLFLALSRLGAISGSAELSSGSGRVHLFFGRRHTQGNLFRSGSPGSGGRLQAQGRFEALCLL